ncbi:MAG TPA: sigma-70 family RNA polymerase sigma factor, partial [Verrucomicrobiae bacterium]|nr:sigma-70 family RNA polymerase sigma factor [Verrucomicrobiae bacterium]
MTPDAELLRQYVEDGSEAAFAELVNRHANLVCSAALRQVQGNIHLAQDVTQSVFTDLARKARKLTRHNSLAGWLYTSVRFAAANLRRDTWRREQREQNAQAISAMSAPPNFPASPSEVDRLASTLDEAMHTLREQDRHAIILRFFQNKPFADVGESLGLNENAARKRVERALEKLRTIFERHGITISGVVLTELLAAQAVSAAPAGLATLVTKSALITASAAPPLAT